MDRARGLRIARPPSSMENLSTPIADCRGPSLRDRRLGQIYRRDPQAEGRFWYSVVTTGVYCRPTCPSRRAHAGNIRLHETLGQARATGFRPCGRCHPEQPSQNDRHQSLIQTVCRAMEADDAPSFRVLAKIMGVSSPHLHRIFRRVTGTTPSTYARLRAGYGVNRRIQDGGLTDAAAEARSISTGQEHSS